MRIFLVGLASLVFAVAAPQNAPSYAGDPYEGSQSGLYDQDGPGWQGPNGRGGGGGFGRGGFGGGGEVCAGLAGTPQCCQLNALGVAALPCDPPSQQPWDKQSFNQICAANGRSAQCCLLSGVAGAGLLCNQP